jgi:hypothetical protein
LISAALVTRAARHAAKTKQDQRILKPWAQGLFNNIISLKFISWIDKDDFPRITPLIQCAAADSRRLVFSPLAYSDELEAIPRQAKAAVYGLTFQMENVLVRGTFNGYDRFAGARIGTLDIDWVYNSMPPKQGQIYPTLPVMPVDYY